MDQYHAIANLEHRFFELLDTHDFMGVGAMFKHGSLRITVPGRPEDLFGYGQASVTAFLTNMLPNRDKETWGRHMVSNLIVEPGVESGTAQARLNSALIVIAPNKPFHFMGIGQHTDELKLIDGAWWFTSKVITGLVRYPMPV